MKVCLNSSKIDNSKNIAFTAGKTTLGSDFDGVFMPQQFNHDTVCTHNPTVEKTAFQSYFDSFDSFIKKAKGKENKFTLEITTGRNLGEFNFYLKRLKDLGLKVPMADSVITSNGGDKFLNKNTDYFSFHQSEAFSAKNFSQEKRDWVKNAAGGWDGDEVRKVVNKSIQHAIISPKKNKRIARLAEFVDMHGEKGPAFLVKIYDDIIRSNMNEEQIRNHIEALSENTIKAAANPNEQKWLIGELAQKIYKDKQTPKEFAIFKAKTLQPSILYDDEITLEGQLKRLHSLPESIAAIRDDGNLNFNIGLTQSNNSQQIELKRIISDELKKKNITHNIVSQSASLDSFALNGEPLSSISITPVINGQKLDKFHDYKKLVDEIIKGNSNDLVIVAGDGQNDAKMLNLFNYVGEGVQEDIGNIENLKKMHKLPLISIFVDNGQKVDDGGLDFALIDKYFNSDGNVRFIHVNPKDPTRPKNLLEATQVAIKEYAKRNIEFANNLSEEMKEVLSKMTYEYPIDRDFIKQLEDENHVKLFNPIKKAGSSKTTTLMDSFVSAGKFIARIVGKRKI